jgi:aryl-alcohol dehydrogenase-like predicted oxidoreductase
MAQIALAWVLAQPGVSAPIVGSTSISHLEDLAASVHIELSPDEIEAISSPYRPQAIVRLTPASLCAPCRPP